MHEFLKEIYFDFCLKNDMPKHNDVYLSADDYLHGVFGLTHSQLTWLKNYVIMGRNKWRGGYINDYY